MESNDKDIKKFDLLESSDQPMDDELRAIKKMDGWISKLSGATLGGEFTSRVMMSAMLAKKRKTNLKIISWLMAVFVLIAALSFMLFPFSQETTLPTQMIQVYEQMDGYIGYLTDPKMKQFLLVLEGIVCLVILEKIISSFKLVKHST